MALQWQSVDVPFGGLESRTTPPLVEPGKMLVLENLEFDRTGGLRHRAGTTSITPAGSGPSLIGVASSDNHVVVVDSRGRVIARAMTSPDNWREVGRVPSCKVTRRDVLARFTTANEPDAAVVSDKTIVHFSPRHYRAGTWPLSTQAIVVDRATNAVLHERDSDGPGGGNRAQAPRVVTVGTIAMLCYERVSGAGTSQGIDVWKYDGFSDVWTAPTSPVVTALRHFVAEDYAYDVAELGANWLACYALGDPPVGDLKVVKLNATPTVTATFTSAGVDAGPPYGLHADTVSDRATVAYRNAALNQIFVQVIRPSTMTSVLGATLVFDVFALFGAGVSPWSVSVFRFDATTTLVAMTAVGSAGVDFDDDYVVWRTVTDAGVLGPVTTLLGISLAGKLFSSGGHIHAPCSRTRTRSVSNTETQSAAYIVPLYDMVTATRPATYATCLRGAFYARRERGGLSNVVLVGTNRYEWAAPIFNSSITRTDLLLPTDEWVPLADQAAAITRVQLDFAMRSWLQAATFGPWVLFSGGTPSVYDGEVCAELGFAWRGTSMVATSVAGTVLTTGQTYQWRYVYEWFDAQGALWRSVPSPVRAKVAAAAPNQAENMKTNNLGLTAKERPVLTVGGLELVSAKRIVLVMYRTVGNGVVLFRASDSQDVPGDWNGNSQSSHSNIVYIDHVTDAILTSRPAIYTNGGVLDNQGPPSAGVVVGHGTRVFLADMEDPRLVWYSKEHLHNVGLEFNEDLSIRLWFDVVALASFQEKLVIFGVEDVAVLVGDGPNDAGQQNDFALRSIHGGIGCIDKRSVVVGQDGVYFQSKRGIYRLDLGLNLTPVGAPIQPTLEADSTILASVAVATRHQVWFARATDVLVYDHLVGQWSIFKYKDGRGAIAQINALAVHDGSVRMALESGALLTEVAGSVTDGGVDVILGRWRTPWIKVAGVQGWQRTRKVLVLGAGGGAQTATVRAAYNYDDTFVETYAFSDAQLPDAGPVQVGFRPARQKAEAISLDVTEAAVGGVGFAGITWQGLRLEIGVERGVFRLPAGSRL